MERFKAKELEIVEINANLADIKLWISLKEGNEFALNKLVKKFFNPLLNYGFKFVKDEAFVKDCVQEVFIEIWKRRERLSIPNSIKAYLLSCVRKKVVREGFRQNIIKSDEENKIQNAKIQIDSSIEKLIIEEESSFEISEKVKKALFQLPKRQYEVLYLQYYQNLNREEIADIMGVKAQSVSNLTQSAFKSFRENWTLMVLFLIVFNLFQIL